ncbi:lysosomal cystine transporter [Seiridium cupressi]
MQFLVVLSAVFGWVYTICWSASFYSQPLLSYRRKSTSGTTVDFPLINTFVLETTCGGPGIWRLTSSFLTGFCAYFTSNAAFYWSPLIRHQYALRNGEGHEPTVAFNDIVFALHAVIVCTITTSQYFLPSLWGFEHAPGIKPSRMILGVATGSIIAVAVVIFIVAGQDPSADARHVWAWLDVVYTISYVKLFVTLIKYAPQLWYNARNKSTKGWSIWQILLDFAGGILSIAQLGIDSYLQGDWTGITGNPVKFALGNVSMLYDLCFMTQHFVLYRGTDGAKGEREALLERGEEDRRLD